MNVQSVPYKEKTNAIKKRIKTLRNEKTKLEAENINNFASKREIEELCRCFKNDNESFAKSKKSSGCDPTKLKDYFKNHFNRRTVNDQPQELTNIPDFVKKLQELPSEINSEPPKKDEITTILKLLKNRN